MRETQRQQNTLLRRKQFLAEAAKIIGERGYFGFGLQELAERCGVTKAGLLHHFGSKDQLLIEMLRERDRHDSAAIGERLRPGDFIGEDVVTREATKEVLREIVARNAEQPEMLRLFAVLSTEALSPRHPAHDYFVAREAATLEIFAQMLAPHFDAPRSVALHLLAAIKGLGQQWLRTPDAFDLNTEWDGILDTIFG